MAPVDNQIIKAKTQLLTIAFIDRPINATLTTLGARQQESNKQTNKQRVERTRALIVLLNSVSLTYISTYRIGEYFLSFECVDGEHGHVADEKEGDNLATGLAAIMLRQVDTTTRYIGNEEQLQDHLEDGHTACGRHQ